MKTTLNKLAQALALAGALLTTALSAHASVISYTDFTAFQAALAGNGSDNYDDLTAGAALAGPLSRMAGSFDYQVAAVPSALNAGQLGDSDFYPVAPGGTTALSANFADSTLHFTGFASTVRGLGGRFFSTDVDGALVASTQLLLLSLTEADGTVTQESVNTGLSGFYGFISTGSLLAFSVQNTNGNWASVDDFSVGAAANAVPEPASLGLALCGLMLATSFRRRRGR